MTDQEMQMFIDTLKEIKSSENSQFSMSKKFVQHGKTSVYRHSVSVAYNSLRLAKKLHIHVDERALIRGALLHDYFLYDWHDKTPNRPLHGYFHPGRALRNANRDFVLSEKEKDIIKNHMFPLTIFPPKHREGVLVCLVDKWVSTIETVKRN